VFDATGAKVGTEFLVNAQPGQWPVISGLANGGFVLTWAGDYLHTTDVWAQLFDGTGERVGGEFLVNTRSGNYQFTADTTSLNDGGFVVAWRYDGGNADNSGIAVQIFDVTGAKVGAEVLVKQAEVHSTPSVTGLSDGGFVLTWLEGYSSACTVKAQVFDATGVKVGDELLVNTHPVDWQGVPDVTALSDGTFVIVWNESSNVHGQVCDATGAKIGAEFLVTTQVEGGQGDPHVTALVNGAFVVTWIDSSAERYSDLKAQVFDATGGCRLAIQHRWRHDLDQRQRR